MIKKIYFVAFFLTASFGLSIGVNGQGSIGGDGSKIYDNRLCSVKPGEIAGTECRIENPQGLCNTYSTCP